MIPIRRSLGLAALVAPLLAAAAGPSRFSDDYEGALAAARARGVPLVVDAWAPW